MVFYIFYRKIESIEKDVFGTRFDGAVDKNDYTKVHSLEASNLEEVFRLMNAVEEDDLPIKLGIRSMMTGDVVFDETGRGFFCAMVGWKACSWKE